MIEREGLWKENSISLPYFYVFFAICIHCFLFSPSAISEENGHTNTPQKGLLPEDASVASGVLSPQVVQVSEEQNMVPTPVKKASKAKPQIDVKAELEKRQGGKQLLNLVVIGNTVKLHFWQTKFKDCVDWIWKGYRSCPQSMQGKSRTVFSCICIFWSDCIWMSLTWTVRLT